MVCHPLLSGETLIVLDREPSQPSTGTMSSNDVRFVFLYIVMNFFCSEYIVDSTRQ